MKDEKIITQGGKRYKVIEILEDYETIKHGGKEFRIYIWENKSIKDFKYPKGFRMAEFQEFIDLIDNKKTELEIFKDYLVKHFSKRFQKTKYPLSWVCLDRDDSDLGSYGGALSDSYGGGRVVCVKEMEDEI